jgi:hypothetical protein
LGPIIPGRIGDLSAEESAGDPRHGTAEKPLDLIHGANYVRTRAREDTTFRPGLG